MHGKLNLILVFPSLKFPAIFTEVARISGAQNLGIRNDPL